jgi:hypothetical protein
VAADRIAALGPGPYLLLRNRAAARQLRALDPGALARLPALKSDEPVIPAGMRIEDVTLLPGMRLVFTAAAEPTPSSLPLVEFAAPFDVAVPFMDLLTVDFLDFALFQKKFGEVDPQAFLDLYWDWPVTVRLQPFTMVRAAHGDVVRRAVVEHTRTDDPEDALPGRLFQFGRDDVNGLPFAVAERANAWAGGVSVSASAMTRPDGPTWPAGRKGLLITPVFAGATGRVLAAKGAESLRREAKELAHILLDLEDSFFSGAHKFDALERFLLAWRQERPKPMMEVLFTELDRLGAFTELYDLLYRRYALYGWMRVAVIGNVTGTRFEQRPEVQRLVVAMNQVRRDVMSQITWDPVTNDLVFVHSGKHLRAAGPNNADPNAGVIGFVEPYFSTKGVVSRPTKKTLERLEAPTRRKVQELMLGMLCRHGESRTKEELIAEAVQAAAAELKLDPKEDFERVTVRFSFRVITVDRQTEHGLDVVYVTLQPVQKFADENWEDSGPRKSPMTLAALDAELVSIHVGHEMAALTVLFLAEALLLTGGYIVITGGWLGAVELVVAISIRELIYVWRTAAADRDLEGYLTEALFGVVDVLGFRLGAQAGIKLAGRWVTQEALQQATTKWLVFATKGLASSAALGSTQVVLKFADDLFHLSSCRRWSSPMDYLKEFGTGFAVGLTFEFAIGPALSVAGRAVIRKLASSKIGPEEAAEALLKELRASDIEELAAQGSKNLEEALLNTFKPEKASLVAEFMQAVRKNLKEVVEHAKAIQEPAGLIAKMRAEWTSRAVADLLEAAKTPLGPHARTGVDILIRSATKEEMNGIVGMLAREPQLRELLEASPKVGAELLTRSAKGAFEKPGELMATVDLVLRAPRLRAFLEANPRIGGQLLTRAFNESRDVMEDFLGHVAKLPAGEGTEVVAALLRIPRLSVPESKALAQIGESAAGRLGGFLRIAELDEIHSLLRLVADHPHLEQQALAELLHRGATQPRRFGEVVSALEHRLSHGGQVDEATVRGLFASTRRSAEEEALEAGQRTLRKKVTAEQASKSIEKDVRFGERKEELPGLHKDEPRVSSDLERARIERERYEIMKNGDPTRGGERRPLAFETWEEYDAFKKEFAELVEKLAEGKAITAQGQVIGTSTSFYSGNPDKPLGHYFDRNAPRKPGDVDVDLFSPELVDRMIRAGGASVNEKVMVGGERTIFKNQGTGGTVGFHDRYPAVDEFVERWSERLGRDVDVKLRLDRTLPQKPDRGPIEVFRKETK